MNIIMWVIIGLIAGTFAGKAIKANGIASLFYVMAGIIGALVVVGLASVVFGAEFLARISIMTITEVVLGALTLIFILRHLPDKTRT